MLKLRDKWAKKLENPKLRRVSLANELLALLHRIKDEMLMKDDALKPLQQRLKAIPDSELKQDPLGVVTSTNPYILITHNSMNLDLDDRSINKPAVNDP